MGAIQAVTTDCRLAAGIAALACVAAASPARAAETDFLLLPTWIYFDAQPESGPGFDDDLPFLDLFVTSESDRFRFMGELVLSESRFDIDVAQRFLVGLRTGDGGTLWAGRFHSPLGYWNMAFHHGGYFKTSISRPSVVRFESEGGPLPMHLVGLLYSGDSPAGDLGAVNWLVGGGYGPEFDGQLDEMDLFSPSRGEHDFSGVVRLGYQPDIGTGTEFGLFLGGSRIPGNFAGIDRIDQLQAGVYANVEVGRTRLIAEYFHLDNEITDRGGSSDGAFGAAYVQGELSLGSRFTAYGRLEDTFGGDGDPYLALFPALPQESRLGGLRVELGERAAMAFEIAREESAFGVADVYSINFTASLF